MDGTVEATGTHEQLLATSAAYRDVVARGMDELTAVMSDV
jgi:hypothetical protein